MTATAEASIQGAVKRLSFTKTSSGEHCAQLKRLCQPNYSNVIVDKAACEQAGYPKMLRENRTEPRGLAQN